MLAAVTVSASAAKQLTAPARRGLYDVRGGSSALAGSYAFESGDEVVTGWHSHDLHQLEYAFEGVARVDTADAHYLLPPQQAAWIPAGVEHCTTLTRVRTVSVFFHPALGLRAHDRVRIIAVSPVLREMVLYARRWPVSRPDGDPVAAQFLTALGALIEESLDDELPLRLPVSRQPQVAAAMRYTSTHLADATFAGACAAAAASPRTLRRAFQAEAAMPWRQYLLESRLLRAMALLAEPAPPILAVAGEVGFDSPGGFTRAFRRYTGETPLDYRRRIVVSER
jgi:AraC-like DNA-binding protein/quercetin dioxygenase-like cupin family protein